MDWFVQKLSSLSASTWAAWWGAILSTIVFLWNWCRTYPRLKVRAAPDMQLVGGSGKLEPQKYITVSVVNVGTTPTTATHLYLIYYASRLRLIFRRPSQQMIVAKTELGQPLPKLVNVGEAWSCVFEQTSELSEMLAKCYLHCGVRNESTAKCTYTRITPWKRQPTDKD